MEKTPLNGKELQDLLNSLKISHGLDFAYAKSLKSNETEMPLGISNPCDNSKNKENPYDNKKGRKE